MGDTFDAKLALLAEVFSFELTYVANAHAAAHDRVGAKKSQVTLAGFDGRTLKIAHVDLVPSVGPGPISYHTENEQVIVVGAKLEHVVAGIPYVAKPILDDPTRLSPRDKLDPILGGYAEAMAANQGRNLSLDDMEILANELVRRTHSKYPKIVGGDRQVAVLSQGKIASFDEPVPTQDATPVDTDIAGGIKIEGN